MRLFHPAGLWMSVTSSVKTMGDKHSVKSVHIQSYAGPYFPAFKLNTKRYSVFLRIQSEWGKIQTRKTLNTDTVFPVKHAKDKKNIIKLGTIVILKDNKEVLGVLYVIYSIVYLQNSCSVLQWIQLWLRFYHKRVSRRT